MKNSKHIAYIDGLKGFCALWVTIFHYILAFVVGSGYIGWESGIAQEQKLDYFWQNIPLAFFSNASFPLHIFFAIIAFLPAWHFFNNQDVEWIKKQAIVRYFRFVPYVFIITVISYLLYINGAYFHEELGALLNLRWPAALMQGDLSWSDVFVSSFFRAYIYGEDSYAAVLWCMHIIFLGSYIAYALLLLFGSSKKYMHIYALILIVCCYALPWAMPFVGGIMVASIACSEVKNPSNSKIRAYLGWALLSMGLALGLSESGLTLNGIYGDILKTTAALSVLLSIFYLDWLQKIFCNKFFIYCGKYVFSMIVMHCLIMISISAWMFIKLYEIYGYNLALCITFLMSFILNAIATVLFAKIVDPICAYLSKHAYDIFK